MCGDTWRGPCGRSRFGATGAVSSFSAEKAGVEICDEHFPLAICALRDAQGGVRYVRSAPREGSASRFQAWPRSHLRATCPPKKPSCVDNCTCSPKSEVQSMTRNKLFYATTRPRSSRRMGSQSCIFMLGLLPSAGTPARLTRTVLNCEFACHGQAREMRMLTLPRFHTV